MEKFILKFFLTKILLVCVRTCIVNTSIMRFYIPIGKKQQNTKQVKYPDFTKENYNEDFFFSQLETSLPFPSDDSKMNIEKDNLLMVQHGKAFSIYIKRKPLLALNYKCM